MGCRQNDPLTERSHAAQGTFQKTRHFIIFSQGDGYVSMASILHVLLLNWKDGFNSMLQGRVWGIILLLTGLLIPSMVWTESTTTPDQINFSRIIIYDVRGMNHDESAMIIEQKNNRVTIWYQNYLGKRHGTIPVDDYQRCFLGLKNVKHFALRKDHRGKPLRRNAAKGSITLAWKTAGNDKQIRTIQYYAPENTLDEFRIAFNRVWALSRYAILSSSSLTSSHLTYLEDGLYFLSGTGWMTNKELQSVVDYQVELGHGRLMAKTIWSILDQPFSSQSVFKNRKFLFYSVKRSMLTIGAPAIDYLNSLNSITAADKRGLADRILQEFSEVPKP